MSLHNLNESLELKYGISEAFNTNQSLINENAFTKAELIAKFGTDDLDIINAGNEKTVTLKDDSELDEGIFDRLKARANSVAAKLSDRAAKKAEERGDFAAMERNLQNSARRSYNAAQYRAKNDSGRINNSDDALAYRANARIENSNNRDAAIQRAAEQRNNHLKNYLQKAVDRMNQSSSEDEISKVALEYWNNLRDANGGNTSMLRDFAVQLTQAKRKALQDLKERGNKNTTADIDPDFR